MLSILFNSNAIINKIKINYNNKLILKNKNEDKIKILKTKILELEQKQEKIIERKAKIEKDPYKIKVVKNSAVKYLIIIFIICLFTGLLTPIGLTPYTYLNNTMHGNTTQNINEHLPLILVNDINFICILLMFLSILIFTDTKIRLSDLLMLSGLLLLAFYTRRQTSMFIIINAFILNRLICSMFNKYDPEGSDKLKMLMTKRVGTITTIAIVLMIAIPIYKPKTHDTYIDEQSYPVEASKYILENLDVKNIKLYNEYNYGSYLLFQNIPVFIDSRADLYSPEFNSGVDIFNDFLELSGVNTNDIEGKLDKYGITHLIMYSNAKLRVFIKQNPSKYKQLYDDGHFCIYERIS